MNPLQPGDPTTSQLEDALRDVLGTSDHRVVDARRMTRATYSTDASNYRHVPLAVVAPRSEADVLAVLQVARDVGVPVLPRGAGTSVAGQATNTAVVMDFRGGMDALIEIDPQRRAARVQPGLILDELRAAASSHALTFGPDPSTHDRCTVGGMVGNNACGSHSLAWGKTDENVRSLEVVLPDGSKLSAAPSSEDDWSVACGRDDRIGALYRSLDTIIQEYGDDIRRDVPQLGRRVSGYDLSALLPENGRNLARALVGSEGTCATVIEAEVDLVPSPGVRALCLLGFPHSVAAADAVPALRELSVLAIEGIDVALVETFAARASGRMLPDLGSGRAWLYVETGGESASEATAVAEQVASLGWQIGASQRVVTDRTEQRALWRIREEGAGLATRLPGGGEAWPGWEDAAVPPARLGAYLRDFEALMQRHDRRGVVYGHFGDGCLHVRIDFPFTRTDGAGRYRAFMEQAADLVVSHGGSLSGEHGDGQARSELLSRMYSPRVLEAFAAFKAAFDPDNVMNPHRIVDPAPLDANLRPALLLAPVPLRLALPEDGNDLAAASRRCVGVGKCVSTLSGGLMCPSYRATRQEEHSTRGRARLLFEMLSGDVLDQGWQSPEVNEALDLCLGCKGCKTDCPVGVDMATYKAEFLYQRYRRRHRPAAHYSMGALPVGLRVASRAPRLFNAFAQSPLIAPVKRIAGVATERAVPLLATRTMRQQLGHLARQLPLREARPDHQLMLWPDTFTNHFDPNSGVDAAASLNTLGFDVSIPAKTVCCGLTWYSTGQLDRATRTLRKTLDTFEPWIDAGAPIVGLEPSCTAMLKHDAARLLPDDPRIPRLAELLHTFAEAIHERLPDSLTTVGPILTQVHCHQYSELGYAADLEVLGRISTDLTVVGGGCCGLAGNFGFERGHYDVSVSCAEDKLLPAIRAAGDDRLVHADGFSCRTQIRQLTNRRPVHLATLVARALEVGST